MGAASSGAGPPLLEACINAASCSTPEGASSSSAEFETRRSTARPPPDEPGPRQACFSEAIAPNLPNKSMAPFSLRGTFTALVTPFSQADGSIDWPAYERHLEAQIAGKIDGLVPCGTTGESPTLSEQEKFDLVRRAV